MRFFCDLNIFLESLGREKRLCTGIRDDVSDFSGRISGVHGHCDSTCLDGGKIPHYPTSKKTYPPLETKQEIDFSELDKEFENG